MKKFQTVQIRRPKSNAFDLSHEKKLTCNMGELIPIYLQEVVPGDKFKVSTEIFMRFAPMLAPIMHRINVFTHYFFVPNRIVWDNWEDFITGGEDGEDTHALPTLSASSFWYTNFKEGGLADYMGIPPVDQTTEPTSYQPISALPFRAHLEIYNEYYRDQNLEAKIPYSKGDVNSGQEPIDLLTLRTRAWEKDYFTSALPWAQRGGEVGIPVEFNYKPASELYLETGEPMDDLTDYLASNNDGELSSFDGTSVKVPGRVENLEEEGVSVSINELRKAARLQEWLEKNARAGARYAEQILSHFGVKSQDSRLQRPEFLAGGKHPVVISEVLNTTGEASATEPVDYAPVGEMYGHGIAIGKNHGFQRRFTEHGYIIGIMSVLPRTSYNTGIDRMWTKYDKFDYYWPEFANLGEQEIFNRELWFNNLEPAAPPGTPGNDLGNTTFGYQERYAEYKYTNSTVHAAYRTTLDFWHLGREFTGQPVLNNSFIKADPSTRIFAVTDEDIDHLYVQIYNRVRALRPMPYFGTPRL